MSKLVLARCKKCKKLLAEHTRPIIAHADAAMKILLEAEQTRHARSCDGKVEWVEADT